MNEWLSMSVNWINEVLCISAAVLPSPVIPLRFSAFLTTQVYLWNVGHHFYPLIMTLHFALTKLIAEIWEHGHTDRKKSNSAGTTSSPMISQVVGKPWDRQNLFGWENESEWFKFYPNCDYSSQLMCWLCGLTLTYQRGHSYYLHFRCAHF